MATYSIAEPHFIVKVLFDDPCGGFSGWFLHVVNADHMPSQPGNGTDAGNTAGALTAGGSNANARAEFHASISARIQQMFGFAPVTWTATIVQSVTPATIDDDI